MTCLSILITSDLFTLDLFSSFSDLILLLIVKIAWLSISTKLQKLAPRDRLRSQETQIQKKYQEHSVLQNQR